MRKLLVLSLTAALFLTALVLPPLTGASKNGKTNRSASSAPQQGEGAPVMGANPLLIRAVNFGESAPVRELAKQEARKSKKAAGVVRDREELLEQRREEQADKDKNVGDLLDERVEQMINGEVTEKNERNREIMRKLDANAKTAPDAALALVPGSKGNSLAPQVMPTPLVSFDGISIADTIAVGQGFLPPDTNGEIGPNHFVQSVNSTYRIFSRTGTPSIPTMTLGSLFATIPGPCANDDSGDPIVLYDQLADRWIISEFCTVANPNNHQLIAVSKTGDPTGAYYLYDFMMPNNKFNDYPHFGVWPDAYYMTDNQFNQAGTQFLGAGAFAFDRTKMLAGDPTASFIYFDKAEGCPAACQFGGMLPSDLDGFTPPPAGAPNAFMQFDADEDGVSPTDRLRIFDFHADFATPANSTFNERTGSPLTVAAFDPRPVPDSRNVIPQPPPATAGSYLDAISDRLMFRLAYRNFGTREALVLNHTVNAATNPTFRAGVRYYELDRTSPAAAWTVQEQATMAGAVGDTNHRWMGSAAVNNSGSLAVGYSTSSVTTFPSVRYAGRLFGDPAGSLAQGEATLVAGAGSQTSTSGRWGDYSDLTVDPTDDCTFWYTQEYYPVSSEPGNTTAPWHTRIGSFQFGPCAPRQVGILTGTVTSAVGGAPIVNATVQASNGFGRVTNGSGVYNIDPMATGTVTLTVSAPGYVTAVVPGVNVTLGNTTTQNVQLTPQNILAGGTPVITAESCLPANNAIDPGETVTLNLPIVNNGGAGATTANLVATLQATGGVSSPSGPQNYGAVAQGAPAVVRPFTFTVSATCGSNVNITLQLQDGATSYGTVVYTLRTGTLGAPSTALYTTGNIATPIPDVSSVDVPINIAATGAAGDVNVRVRLNHTFDADVTIALIAPDGTTVTLAANRDTALGGGDNYGTGANDCSGTPTIFDDSAATAIGAGTPPFAGTFKPETPLAAFNGKSITGTWILRVSDNAAQDVGTVGCVTLEIARQPFVCCGVAGTPVIGSGGNATITAESIAPANNAPDPGETVTATFPILNTGDGATTNLVGTLQASGGITPVGSPSRTYGAVTAGGAAVAQPYTFVASGTCGSTITASIQFQDGAINLGTVTYTFRLGTTSSASQTFSNATPIVIPATGTGATTGAPATPYPSNITVAGITAPVSKVTVALKQITHTFPSDVDVLLVGPTGVKFVLMSDVIGGTDWTGQTYTFDDTAAALLPSSGTPPATGSFKPTNYGTGDVFPAPAPAAPYLDPATAGTATLASAFNNLDPNGTWSLYVVDDAGTDVGTFAGGWDLSITTTQSICNTQTCSISCPANITVPADSGGTSAVVNYPAAGVTGACGVLGYSTPSGSTFPVGTTQVTVTGANSATCQFSVTVTSNAPAISTTLAISEFREHGAAGAADEYIELANLTNAPFTIPAGGWSVAALNAAGTVASLVATIPAGTSIPARGHYLIANSTASTGYSLGTYATPDATFTADIPDNVGLALFSTANVANYSAATRVDGIGFTGQSGALPTLYGEGTRLAPVTGDGQYAFVRRMETGIPLDTGDSAADFVFVSTTGGSFSAQSVLGAPGPENLASPTQRNATVKATLIDATQASTAPPNRIRDTTPGTGATANGTLDIRRKFTNTTGAIVTALRFRIVDVTTLNTPNPGGQQADLRYITSADTTANGGTITITGTTLEAPAVGATGGGLNASGVVAIPGGTLANNSSINVRFLLGVAANGRFRFFVNVEGLTNPPSLTEGKLPGAGKGAKTN